MTIRVAQLTQQHLRFFAQAGIVRGLLAVLSVLAICLQSFAPSIARAADLEWMVICSDEGTKLVQVDLAEGQQHEPCPDCDECHFCAPMSDLATPVLSVFDTPNTLARNESSIRVVPVLWNTDYLWPVTRGPPSATNDKKDRVFRAFPVSNSKKGEAL